MHVFEWEMIYRAHHHFEPAISLNLYEKLWGVTAIVYMGVNTLGGHNGTKSVQWYNFIVNMPFYGFIQMINTL